MKFELPEGLSFGANWTEEQWAAHDERVKAETAKEEAHERERLAYRLSDALRKEDWPSRAIEVARAADMSAQGVARISEWAHRDRNVCVLSGPAGTGKTVAAAWWRLKNGGMNFIRASTFAASSRYDEESRSRVYGARALCLDDLGAEYLDVKGSFLVDLDELVDTFYADRRPLIITTNLEMPAFKKRYGNRVEDRIRECAQWIVVGGASMRRSA